MTKRQHHIARLGLLLLILGASIPLLTWTQETSYFPPSPIVLQEALEVPTSGWACGDFPCERDIDGFLARMRVSAGFDVSYVGRFSGQVNQLAYDSDGVLYATVLENGTLQGAVYRMNADNSTTRISQTLNLPIGLAFHPTDGTLYVSGRTTPLEGGSVWRIETDGTATPLIDTLPCCFMAIDNQPNGMIFGQDGWLYVGVGALTDRTESKNPSVRAYETLVPFEASIIKMNVDTGEIVSFATRIRNPYDITQDSLGQLYATDTGMVAGVGDRLLQVNEGVAYGFPFYGNRGCTDCPTSMGNDFSPPDFLALPAYTLPRGLVAYTGIQFPPNLRDGVFVALWNQNTVLWVSPVAGIPPVRFLTGILRPSDVILAPDGALIVSDWIYGHVWRVTYVGVPSAPPSLFATNTPAP